MATAKGSEWALAEWGPGWPHCDRNRRVPVEIFGRTYLVVAGSARAFRRIDLIFRKKAPDYYRTICSTAATDTGTFSCRPISGTSRPSFHSWPLSVDVRWQRNPRGTKDTEIRKRGMAAVGRLRLEDFVWGGDWSTPDDMHVELSQTREQLKARYFRNGWAKPWYRRRVGKL